jgi:hypothetical protein
MCHDAVRDSTTIRCCISPMDGSESVQTTFTLRSLRINVFPMLSHVLKAQSWRRHKSCPAVYINGDAYAVGTINLGRQGYQRLPDAASIISEQMKAVRPGQKYARKFIALPRTPSCSQDLLLSNPSLIELWGRLRWIY